MIFLGLCEHTNLISLNQIRVNFIGGPKSKRHLWLFEAMRHESELSDVNSFIYTTVAFFYQGSANLQSTAKQQWMRDTAGNLFVVLQT